MRAGQFLYKSDAATHYRSTQLRHGAALLQFAVGLQTQIKHNDQQVSEYLVHSRTHAKQGIVSCQAISAYVGR